MTIKEALKKGETVTLAFIDIDKDNVIGVVLKPNVDAPDDMINFFSVLAGELEFEGKFWAKTIFVSSEFNNKIKEDAPAQA